MCVMFLILKALVHVSTAYANCDRSIVSETIYPAPLLPKKIINAVEWVSLFVFIIIASCNNFSRTSFRTFRKNNLVWFHFTGKMVRFCHAGGWTRKLWTVLRESSLNRDQTPTHLRKQLQRPWSWRNAGRYPVPSSGLQLLAPRGRNLYR